MESNPEKKNEILQRQCQQLMSQLFHMIGLNSGYRRRISELERLEGDKVHLTEHAPSEESMDIPMDLSPSIRRKLSNYEEVKSILHQRNNLIAELERQVLAFRVNSEHQDMHLKQHEAALAELRGELGVKTDEVNRLSVELDRFRRSPIHKIVGKMKRILGGGNTR